MFFVPTLYYVPFYPPLLPCEDGTEEEEPFFWWSDAVQPGTVFMQCELMQWF